MSKMQDYDENHQISKSETLISTLGCSIPACLKLFLLKMITETLSTVPRLGIEDN